MGAMTLGRFIRRRGQTLHSGPPTAGGQSFCCIGQEAQREGAKRALTGQKRYAQKKAFFVCIKTEIFSGVYYTWLVTANGQTQETSTESPQSRQVNGQRSMVIDLKKLSRRAGTKIRRSAKGSGTRCLGSACRRFFPRSPKWCFGRKSREI